jgi:hypothetical protein
MPLSLTGVKLVPLFHPGSVCVCVPKLDADRQKACLCVHKCMEVDKCTEVDGLQTIQSVSCRGLCTARLSCPGQSTTRLLCSMVILSLLRLKPEGVYRARRNPRPVLSTLASAPQSRAHTTTIDTPGFFLAVSPRLAASACSFNCASSHTQRWDGDRAREWEQGSESKSARAREGARARVRKGENLRGREYETE